MEPVDSPDSSASDDPGQPASPAVKVKRRRKHDPTPRLLVIYFCLWLLGAWLVALQSAQFMQPPRWMVYCGMIGLMVLWPALRLSQWRRPTDTHDTGSADTFRTPGRILMDWFCLNVIMQTVIWPLHLNARWHVEQSLWIGATLASWSLIAAAFVALGCQSDKPTRRIIAMLMCLLLIAGEPLAIALVGQAGGGPLYFHISPLVLLWDLTGPAALWTGTPWVVQTPIAALAGVLAWAGVFLMQRWTHHSHEPAPAARL